MSSFFGSCITPEKGSLSNVHPHRHESVVPVKDKALKVTSEGD